MAEFGKIICISIGIYDKNDKLLIRSFAGDNEEELLKEFGEIFNRPKLQNVILCAHNGKEFDFPWIARRFLINGMQPPVPFQMFGKKPWEIPHLDTMELWKFGDWKSFISLELMAHLFGVPTPKDDIDGSMVSSIYYIEKDLPRIVKYCEKDVLTLANVFRKMRQEDLLERREIKSQMNIKNYEIYRRTNCNNRRKHHQSLKNGFRPRNSGRYLRIGIGL
jgi:uncharacterized protein YprB with RNaseH-like and TPR domain